MSQNEIPTVDHHDNDDPTVSPSTMDDFKNIGVQAIKLFGPVLLSAVLQRWRPAEKKEKANVRQNKTRRR